MSRCVLQFVQVSYVGIAPVPHGCVHPHPVPAVIFDHAAVEMSAHALPLHGFYIALVDVSCIPLRIQDCAT